MPILRCSVRLYDATISGKMSIYVKVSLCVKYFHILVFNVLLKRSTILAFVSSLCVVKKWTSFSFRNFLNTLFVNSVPRSVCKRIGCRPVLKMTWKSSFKVFPVLSFNGRTHSYRDNTFIHVNKYLNPLLICPSPPNRSATDDLFHTRPLDVWEIFV